MRTISEHLCSCLVSIWTSPVIKGVIKGVIVSNGQKFSKPLIVQYRATLFRPFHHSSRHPLRHDKRTYINCNVMCFINNERSTPLGDCGGWRMAMWCLIIQGTWEINAVESTQHPPLSLLPVITSSNLSSFLFFPPHLAAFQSIPINIQCLCTLSSGLFKWHNP